MTYLLMFYFHPGVNSKTYTTKFEQYERVTMRPYSNAINVLERYYNFLTVIYHNPIPMAQKRFETPLLDSFTNRQTWESGKPDVPSGVAERLPT